MPDSVSEERRKLVKHYGAEVILVHDAGNIGKCIDECLELALKMQREDENVFVPQQFENPANPEIQRKQTAKEILDDTDNKVDIVVAGIGTGGTAFGLRKFLPSHIKVYGVEPSESPLFTEGKAGAHKIQGIGAGFVPNFYDNNLVDEIIRISDEEAIDTAKLVAKTEGLAIGISGGAAVCGAIKIAQREDFTNKRLVVILPDSVERYLSTGVF
jgi:cysteine synthase A